MKNERQFLMLFVDLANSDVKNRLSIIEKFFKYRFVVESHEVEALKENVIAFATANTAQVPFSVQIEKEGGLAHLVADEKNIYYQKNTSYHGTVKYFLKDPPKVTEKEIKAEENRLASVISKQKLPKSALKGLLEIWIDLKQRVPDVLDDLPLNHLVGGFYQAISDYCQKRKCGMLELPLRICKHEPCSKPFLGRLREQMFCCKRHGEIFHGKEAYRRKTTGATKNKKK